jgi:hypothetical protein
MTDNKSLDSVEHFKYLGPTITNENFIQEGIKKRLNSRNGCYHSAQSILCSSLLTESIKIRLYRTIIFPLVLYGFETWSLTMRGERRLRMFANGELPRIFGPERDEIRGEWREVLNEKVNDL